MNPIREKIEKALALTEKVQAPPTVGKISFELPFIWIGDSSGEMVEVEIKNEHGELGWLYSSEPETLLIFRCQMSVVGDSTLLAIKVDNLKTLAESQLKEKKFSDKPELGKLVKSGKRITGYVTLEYESNPHLFELV